MQQRMQGISRFVFATMLLALGIARSAAAIDLSGVYVGQGATPAGSFPCDLTFAQSGTSLQITGSCFNASLSASGTVDPETGAFSAAGAVSGFCPSLVGTGTGDGEVFTATFTGNGVCGLGGTLSGTKCSNGVLDPLEQCDPGNAPDVCCSANCQAAPQGTPCAGDGESCTDDVCNASGRCSHVPMAPGQTCSSDGNPCTDDICSTCDACTPGTVFCNHVPNTGPCDDGNVCTTGDVCAGVSCRGTPNTDPCDDGNACTISDVCGGGICHGVAGPAGHTCTNDGNDCSEDICDAAGTCTHTGVVPVCVGTIDLTGAWSLNWTAEYCLDGFGFDFHRRNFVQAGAVLTESTDVAGFYFVPGAINPATGDLTAKLAVLGYCGEVITGVATPDGSHFTGTASTDCCSTNFGAVAVTGVRCGPLGADCCGNGTVEAGEVCDDPVCCDTTCQHPQGTGTACADDSNVCTSDICGADGTCHHNRIIGGPVCAGDQTIRGNQELVKDPRPGDATKRKLVCQGKEMSSDNTIVGDPTVGGATLAVFANGATSSTQEFTLPANLWAADGSGGFRYKDATGAAGPVKAVQIRKSGNAFQIKALVLGKHGAVNVVPPNLGTDGCVRFTIADGDRYHLRFGPGSVIKKNDANTFQIANPTNEGLCP